MLCPHAKKCSGCQLQNMEYCDQLSFKQAKLIKLLGMYGHVDKIIGMEDPLHYRNKVQAAFSFRRGRIVSGVYQSATGAVVPVDECLLEDVGADRIIVTVRRLCADFNIKAFDSRTGKGFLRHVMVRKSEKSGKYMVVLVTARGDFRSKRKFAEELLRRHPEIETLLHSINNTDKGLMLGNSCEILHGDGYITDSLCGLDFRISPTAFFQVNHSQTELLYGIAAELAALTGNETLLDAYCGTGTVGLILAKSAGRVIGVEINRDSVADAKHNARINGIENARFYAADAGRIMDELAESGERIDVVVTDPPRAGCSLAFLKSLISLAPERVVYISCNPTTLSRDLYTLKKGGYKIKKIRPVDLFPYTEHIETVVLLTR